MVVGCGDAVALAIKRKIGRVLAERMLQSILKEVVAKCEWRKTVNMMKGRSKVQIDGEGARRRQSSVVTKMKNQAKMATGKQAVPKKGREKVAKKLAIVKNRVKAKIIKDLSTAERKSPTIKAKKTGLLSLEDLKRRMGSLGTSVSFAPAENVKVPISKKPPLKARPSGFHESSPGLPRFREPHTSPAFCKPAIKPLKMKVPKCAPAHRLSSPKTPPENKTPSTFALPSAPSPSGSNPTRLCSSLPIAKSTPNNSFVAAGAHEA